MARRQNPKIERTLKRTSSLRLVKQTFLIVCEGEVTCSHFLKVSEILTFENFLSQFSNYLYFSFLQFPKVSNDFIFLNPSPS